MGHMIREKGTATFVEVPTCAKLSNEIKFLKRHGYVFDDVYKYRKGSAPDEFTDVEEFSCDNLIRVNNKWYEIKKENLSDKDFIEIEDTDTGLSFDCNYYNGAENIQIILEEYLNKK